MEEFCVVGGGLDRVAERVAEVEGHARAALALLLVEGDDVGLDLDGVGDDSDEDRSIALADLVDVLFECSEEWRRGDDAGFDGLLQSGAEFLGWERGEEVDVDVDGARMVEAPDEVLAGGKVDAGFAADGGVDLGEQRGGNLDERHAAHVDGGEEAGDVADDPGAEGDEERVALGAGLGELLCEGFDGGEALVLLAGGVEEDRRRLGFRERGLDFFAPELPDVGTGDEEGAEGLSGGKLDQARVEGAEEVATDCDVVGG